MPRFCRPYGHDLLRQAKMSPEEGPVPGRKGSRSDDRQERKLQAHLYNLIKEEIKGQRAYATGMSAAPIRLDANENPFSLPDELHKEFLASLVSVPLNRYPAAGSPEVLARFAKSYRVAENMVMVGNGSDELIQVLCTALSATYVLAPVPTFAMYRICALNSGHKVLAAPLNDEFDLDLPVMLTLIDKYRPALVFLSYPNNPTGNCFSREKMETLLQQAPGLVVVDEAYGYFSGQSFLTLLGKYENLVVLKTLSKIGLAALRIGFLIAAPPLVQELNKVRMPYNLNALSQAAAGFYLDHEAVFLAQAAEIVRERGRLWQALQRLPGIRPYSSAANFIFFSCLFDTSQVYEDLCNQGILIKSFSAIENLKNFMRVTVGTRRENELFQGVLERVIAKLGA